MDPLGGLLEAIRKQEENPGWNKWKDWLLTLKTPKRMTERGGQTGKGIKVSLWSRSWKGAGQHVVRIGEKLSPELQLFQLCLLGVICTLVLGDIRQVGTWCPLWEILEDRNGLILDFHKDLNGRSHTCSHRYAGLESYVPFPWWIFRDENQKTRREIKEDFFFKGLSELPVLIFCKLVYNKL